MAVLLQDSFPGTDGAAVDSSRWAVGQNPTGGSGGGVTIQSNTMRLRTGSAGGYSGNDSVGRRFVVADQADFEVYFEWNQVGENYPAYWFRSTQASDPGAGVGYTFNIGLKRLETNNNYNTTVVYEASAGFNTNTWYSCRLRCEGTSIKIRTWVRGTAEPTTWNWFDGVNTFKTAAGYMGLRTSGGGAAANTDFFIDNVLLSTLSAPEQTAVLAVAAAQDFLTIGGFGSVPAVLPMAASQDFLAVAGSSQVNATLAMAAPQDLLTVGGQQVASAVLPMSAPNDLLTVAGTGTANAVLAMAAAQDFLTVAGSSSLSSVLAMAAAQDFLTIAGSQAAAAVLAVAAPNDLLTLAGSSGKTGQLAMAAVPSMAAATQQQVLATWLAAGSSSLTVAGLKTVAGALAMAVISQATFVGLGPTAALAMAATQDYLTVGATQAVVGTLAMTAAPRAAVDALRTQAGTLAVAGASSLGVVGYRTFSSTLAASVATALAVAGSTGVIQSDVLVASVAGRVTMVAGFVRTDTLSMRVQPFLVIYPPGLGPYISWRKVRSRILSDGRGGARLRMPTTTARIRPGGVQAVLG